MEVKSNKLNKSECEFRKNRSISLKGSIGFEYAKSLAVLETFKEAIENGYSKEKIYEVLNEKFDELDFPTETTKEINARDMSNCILRYISSESRRINLNTPANQVSLFDGLIETTIKPDMIFVTSQGIEIVKVKASKPKYTKSGKNSYLNARELYAMFRYGADMVPVGKKMNVKASYYYLRKDNDSVSKNIFDWDFFDKSGKNVISIEDSIDKTVFPDGERCGLDETFEPLFEQFFEGIEKEDASEENCETCSFKHLCGYKHAPKYVVKEHKVKSVSDLCLTEQQEKAIQFNKGIARINAGAGAGKTLVVALRVVTLLLNGVRPEEICLLTFTVSGADEMKERVQLYNNDFGTGADTSDIVSTTFNGFADRIVKKEYDRLGFTEEPTLIDDIERSSIIAQLLKDNFISGLDYRNFLMNTRYVKGALAATQMVFDVVKRNGYGLGDEEELRKKLASSAKFLNGVDLTEMLNLYTLYDAILKTENLIEYADQEILMFEVLAQEPDYFEKMGLKHIIVDEFQDSDKNQIELIKQLRDCPSFESLMVVGDDSQAIFSFRDTTPEYIINFFDILGEEGEDFYLLENHRSTPEIIELANKINAINIDKIEKDLIATRANGVKPVVEGFFNKEAEYEYITNKIVEKVNNGTRAEDIAFIASNKYELLDMGSCLTQVGIPWVMLNPEPMLENSKVIAAIALAKAINNPEDTESMLVYLNALFSNELLQKDDEEINTLLCGLQKEIKDMSLVSDAERKSAYHTLLSSIDDDDELFQSFLEKLKYKKDFSQEMKYILDFELYGSNITYKRCKDYPGVVLTTAHSSKGLEWPIVFNSLSKYHGKELGLISSKANRPRFEEKRRLLFVSLTRARDELYVTGQYVAYGPKDDRTYNTYLKEVMEALGHAYNPIDPMEEEKDRQRKEATKKKAQERREKEKEEKKQELLEKGKKQQLSQKVASVPTTEEEARKLAEAELANFS